MNKTPRVLKKNVSTRSHWKDYLTDKKYAFILITYNITFRVVGFFFTGFRFKQKKNPEVSKYLKASTCTCH